MGVLLEKQTFEAKELIKLHNLKIMPTIKETEKKITLVVFENNYHMLLRDLENKKISKVIVDWINKERDFLSFPKSVNFLKNSKFYHILER